MTGYSARRGSPGTVSSFDCALPFVLSVATAKSKNTQDWRNGVDSKDVQGERDGRAVSIRS